MRTAALPLLVLILCASTRADDAPAVSEPAQKIHAAGLLFDGHNDLPYRLRMAGDMSFTKIDIANRLPDGHTDIPRLRQGGVKAQFWSVFVPGTQKDPARTVTEQIDLVHRMIEKYPDVFELALSADDVERIARSGKIASLIGIEGGVAIEGDLAQLRAFARLGARYMTLTHNETLDWADAATDLPKHDGLTPFGERVVREMNRLGMLVDISHVSPATMADAIRVSKAPLIASHSNSFAVAPHARNVPDAILDGIKSNGGVVMINFASGFVSPESARTIMAARKEIREQNPEPAAFAKAMSAWYDAHKDLPRGTIADVADHIDHIRKRIGIDHIGLGADYDGVTSLPVGLEDVSTYPRLTEELVKRGYSAEDVHKILGGNVIRAFRRAGEVAKSLQRTTLPDVVSPPAEKE